MTQAVSLKSKERDSARAGAELGLGMRERFGGANPDAVIVFASAQHDYEALLRALRDASGATCIVGASSAGEFTHDDASEGHVTALAIRSDAMVFTPGVGRDISADAASAAQQVVSSFRGRSERTRPYRSALVMTDALAGHTDALVEELTVATGGSYRFFGGGAGDDGQFRKTHVFAGAEVLTNAVVALEILSDDPIGIGVSHGWVPASEPFRVTEAEGTRLIGVDGAPALQLFEDHARATGQRLDLADPLPFFLHNIIGIESADGYRLRVPLGVNEDGSISCAAAIPSGALVRLMKTTAGSAVVAAEQATRSALRALEGRRPGAALVFDCVATRLRIGNGFNDELRKCAELLAPAGFVGCNTYGQIARAEGQFGGFHNCTAVVCVLPE